MINTIRLLSISLFFVCEFSIAEVATDGTTGVKATIASSNGEYRITEDLGTRSGNNLFHSFETFNVESNATATFTGSSEITNIITRVTGDGASSINGSINSGIAGANFWLLNPKGVIVGEGATFDISGTVNISTADQLNFNDGSSFGTAISSAAISPADSSDVMQNLSIATPASLGFLDDNASSIILDKANIYLQENKLVLVSRTVTFSNSSIELNNAELDVVTSSQLTEIDISLIESMEFTSEDYGDVNLINSEIVINSDSSPLVVKARKLEMVNSHVSNLQGSASNSDTIIDAELVALNRSTIQSSNSIFPTSSLNGENNGKTIVNIAIDNTVSSSDGPGDSNRSWVNLEIGENKLQWSDTNKLTVNESPCLSEQNSSTFSVNSGTEVSVNTLTKLRDPMSFNPGAEYIQVDVKKVDSLSAQLFTSCSI